MNNLHTKFEVSSLSRSGDISRGAKFSNRLCDPEHAPFRDDFSSAWWEWLLSTYVPNFKCLGAVITKLWMAVSVNDVWTRRVDSVSKLLAAGQCEWWWVQQRCWSCRPRTGCTWWPPGRPVWSSTGPVWTPRTLRRWSRRRRRASSWVQCPGRRQSTRRTHEPSWYAPTECFPTRPPRISDQCSSYTLYAHTPITQSSTVPISRFCLLCDGKNSLNFAFRRQSPDQQCCSIGNTPTMNDSAGLADDYFSCTLFCRPTFPVCRL